MSAWGWFLFIWLGSIPTWAFFYFAYRFRRWRDLSRYHFLRGLTYLAFYGALATSFLFPSLFPVDVLLGVFVVLFFAFPFLARPMLRKVAERIAKDPEEAKRYEEATDLFKQ